MSFLTNPTRIHDLEINSDQTWLSRSTLNASSAAFLPSADTGTNADSLDIADGEFKIASGSTAAEDVLVYRDGSTVLEFRASATSSI